MISRSLSLLTRVKVSNIRCKSHLRQLCTAKVDSTTLDNDEKEKNFPAETAGDFSHPPVSTITGINEGADLSNFLYPPTFNTRERRIASILQKHLFSPEQVREIVLYFRERNSVYTVDPNVLKPAVQFWIEAVRPPKMTKSMELDEGHFPKSDLPDEKSGKFYHVSIKSGDSRVKAGEEVVTEDGDTLNYDYRKSEVRTILARNPILLLIDTKAINDRLKRLHELGILSGKNDIWRIFHFAPVSFFLQDWAEFLRKFYYIQHRILEWLIDVHKDPFPVPHPAIKHARVFDLPYHVLKARFEFAIKSGLKSPVIISKNNPNAKTIDLGDIILTPLHKYLKKITPGMTEEEYNLYEKYIEAKDDPEDRILTEMAELEAHSNYSFDKMNNELAKRIAGSVLEQNLNFGKEPLEGIIGSRDDTEVDDEEKQDALRALKDQLLIKRALSGNKRAALMKQRDLERLRLIFPGTKPYPEEGDEEEKVDQSLLISLRMKKD